MTILYIEDDDNDICLVATAAREAAADANILAVSSVVEARAYLEAKGKYADRTDYPVPDLILLDLFLPGRDGFDFLRWRNNTRWVGIPVVVLTSSLDPHALDRATAMGATLSFGKPTRFADLVGLIADLCSTLPAPLAAPPVPVVY